MLKFLGFVWFNFHSREASWFQKHLKICLNGAAVSQSRFFHKATVACGANTMLSAHGSSVRTWSLVKLSLQYNQQNRNMGVKTKTTFKYSKC